MSNTTGGFDKINEDTPDTDDDLDNEDEPEVNFWHLDHLSNKQPTYPTRRKSVSLCRHKLLGRTGCRSRRWRQQPRQHEQNWFTGSEADQQLEEDLLTEDTDPEWAQLREMEEFLRWQRIELLQQRARDSDGEDWESLQRPTEREGIRDVDEDDNLEDADLAFITSILESFSKSKSKVTKPSESFRINFPPEGMLMQAYAKLVTPPKFNHNSMIKTSTTENLSCFPTIEEEGADYKKRLFPG